MDNRRNADRLDPLPPKDAEVIASIAPRALSVFERNVFVYRRQWLMIATGFFEPLFFLLGIGFGVGGVIGTLPYNGVEVPYAAFVAPALLASAAMNGAIFDSTFNVFYKLKYARVYDAILATPVSVGDLAVGELLWSNLRGVIYAVAFLCVMFAFGLVASPLALLTPFAVVFIGFAFGAAGFALTTHLRSWKDFDFVFIILTPLFLFSATFYPVEIYPGALRYVAELSPLTRGTHLIRSLCFGDLNLMMLVDIGFLALIGFLGYRHAVSRLGKLLLK
jgi:lipooligosaccharide transport system permease protein